jgi:hypothetical protein
MLQGIGIEIAQAVEQVLASDVAVNVTLRWRSVVRPIGYDPNDETSQSGGTVTPGSLVFRALVHQVDHRLSGYQRFMEVQTGDVIIDYTQDLALAGKEDVRLEIGGRLFTQKNASAALLEAWDAMTGYGGTMKTLLLTPAQ